MTLNCTCGNAIGDPRVPVCTCKPKQWIGLSDAQKLYFVRHYSDWPVLKLIEAVEFELKEKNNGKT